MNSLQDTLNEEHVDYSKNPDKYCEIAIVFLIITHQEKRSILTEITNLSWLKRIPQLICKEHVLETNFLKIRLKKTNYVIVNKETSVYLFWKKENKEYFAKINENDITDNRETVKSFLLDKVKPKEPVILVSNNDMESNEIEVAKAYQWIFLKYCEKFWYSGISV